MIDLGEKVLFHHHWEESVGSGHASLTLREDWRAHLTRTRKDLGVKRTRFHGLLDDDFSISLGPNKSSYINLDSMVDFHLFGARFSTDIYTRGCHWFPRLFA
jgi:hypothetical protein